MYKYFKMYKYFTIIFLNVRWNVTHTSFQFHKFTHLDRVMQYGIIGILQVYLCLHKIPLAGVYHKDV